MWIKTENRQLINLEKISSIVIEKETRDIVELDIKNCYKAVVKYVLFADNYRLFSSDKKQEVDKFQRYIESNLDLIKINEMLF